MPELHPPARPAIDGLRFRTFAGSEDLPALVEVSNAAMQANGVTEVWTVEALRVEIEGATHSDPREDLLLATVDGRPVAYTRSDWADTTDGDRHYWSIGHVHPAWRRLGVGSALLALGEDRRRTVAGGHHHQVRKILMSWIEESDLGGVALLAANGYQRVRIYHHMVRPDLEDVVVPPLPDGLEVRPVTPDLLQAVFDGMMEAFRDHFGAHDGSRAAFERWRDEPDFDIDLLVIAFDGPEVAGGVQVGIYPDENLANEYLRGWADPVYTRRAWRRRGLASALLGRALLRMRERGMTSAQLDVDTENPAKALTLYERHGFRADRSSSEWHKPIG